MQDDIRPSLVESAPSMLIVLHPVDYGIIKLPREDSRVLRKRLEKLAEISKEIFVLPDDVTECAACGRAIAYYEADKNNCCPYCSKVGYTTSCRICGRALRTSTCPTHGSRKQQSLRGTQYDDAISHNVLSNLRSDNSQSRATL